MPALEKLSRTDRARLLGLNQEQRTTSLEGDVDDIEVKTLAALEELKATLKWQARTTVGGLITVLAVLLGVVFTR